MPANCPERSREMRLACAQWLRSQMEEDGSEEWMVSKRLFSRTLEERETGTLHLVGNSADFFFVGLFGRGY